MSSWIPLSAPAARAPSLFLSCLLAALPALSPDPAAAAVSPAATRPAEAASAAPVRPVSAAAAELLQWIGQSSDNEGRPYVVVDKREARVWVFDARHRQLASSAALLGLTRGDHEVADIRTRDVTRLARQARITPAGRFATEPGVNLQGEDVVWMDYEAGLAMHRVRPGLAQASRLKRLADGVASAQRVSMGCVVLPVAFYEGVIQPLLGRRAGVVYVLPEHSSVRDWLARHQAMRTARAS